MDTDECISVCSDYMVDIVPCVREEQIKLLSTVVPPFEPGVKTRLLLWVCEIYMYKKKVRLVPADWVNEDRLMDMLNQEKSSEKFSPLIHPHMFEMICIYRELCTDDDFPDKSNCRNIAFKIHTVRQEKLDRSIKACYKIYHRL